MCNVGDIILVDSYVDNGKKLNKHSFIVIDDANGTIEGLSYDIICNVLSSFKSDSQRIKKLSYAGNFPVSSDDTDTKPNNNKSGYVKTDQLYYFSKEKIEFKVIGNVLPEILDLIFEFIEGSNFEISDIIDNLK